MTTAITYLYNALHGCKVLYNGCKWKQYMVFNKTVLGIPFPLYRIKLDE